MAAFNPDQIRAIEADNHTILVSAAAGSGKTTVMVEKIKQTLLKHPDKHLSNMLVITFTREAASNMRRKLQDLLLLGYSPREVSKPYIMLVLRLNAAVLVAAIILMLIGRTAYMDMIHAFGVGGASIWVAILVGILIMGAITAGNIQAIRRKISSLWLHEK